MIKVKSVEDLGKELISEYIYKNSKLINNIIQEYSYAPLLEYIYNRYDISDILPFQDDTKEHVKQSFMLSLEEFILDILVDEDKEVNFIFNLDSYFKSDENKKIDETLYQMYIKNKNNSILIKSNIDDILNMPELQEIIVEDVVFVYKKTKHYYIDKSITDISKVNILWDTKYLTYYNNKINTEKND